MSAGSTMQLHAAGVSSSGASTDITQKVTWSSSNTAVATIDSTGVVKALTAGTSTITATSGTLSKSFVLTVTGPKPQSIALSPGSVSLTVGDSQIYVATATYADGTTANITSSVTWSVTPTGVASIDANGVLTAVGIGSYTVTATLNDVTTTITGTVVSGVPTGTQATLTSITVTPTSARIASGTKQEFKVIGQYSDHTTQDVSTQASWNSSNTGVAQVDTNGVASGASAGTTTIQAQIGSLQSTATLVVSAATLTGIHITPATINFAAGTKQQFQVTGTFSDGTTQDLSSQVQWSSSDPSVIAVDANGQASALQPGNA